MSTSISFAQIVAENSTSVGFDVGAGTKLVVVIALKVEVQIPLVCERFSGYGPPNGVDAQAKPLAGLVVQQDVLFLNRDRDLKHPV